MQLSRREALISGLGVAGGVFAAWTGTDAAEPTVGEPKTSAGPGTAQSEGARHAGPLPTSLDADAALAKLLEGNRRFASGRLQHPHEAAAWRKEIVREQHPFAVILGCSDSRVPPEIIFDEGLGDLFVIRQAGHVADVDTLGSVEYAVGHLHVPLVVVLGHKNCGAVQAAVSAVLNDIVAPGHILRLVDDITPAVLSAKDQPGDVVDNVVRANVRLVVDQLNISGPILRPLIRDGRVRIVGAYYDLASGVVEVLKDKS